MINSLIRLKAGRNMPSKGQRQIVRYALYKATPEWLRLPEAERGAQKAEFESIVEEAGSSMRVKSYSLVGTRADADLLLWSIGHSLEEHHEFAAMINRSRMGAYLETPYSYLAMTRRSDYVDEHRHKGQEGTRVSMKPGDAPYLIVYPFVKTRAWYTLSLEERQKMMSTHIEVGHKYPSVRIHTSYSFGIDDQEFVVAFDTDNMEDFLDLVMELRESQASAYTLRDTPVFTCIARPIRQCLDALG